jgi:GST-like protein
LKVLEKALHGRDWIAGDFSIADMAIVPWLRALRDFYKAGDLAGLPDCPNVVKYIDRFLERPAVQRGLLVPAA